MAKKAQAKKTGVPKKKVLKKKPVTKKAASKKAASKKASAKTELVLPGSEAEKILAKADRKRIGQEMLDARGRAPFSIPKNLEEIADRCFTLNSARDDQEIELSALLYTLNEKRAWADFGMSDLSDFAENKLLISNSKARAMVSNYSMFAELGLEPKLFSGKNAVSFTKFKMLGKLIKSGIVTPKNVVEWLPLTKKEGEGAVTTKMLDDTIKKELRKADKDASPDEDPLRKYSVMMPLSSIDAFEDLLTSYMSSANISEPGLAMQQALTDAASEFVSDEAELTRTRGVKALCENIARQAPVIPIVVAQDESYNEFNIGTPTVHCIYSCMVGGNTKFCLASSLESAADHFGVDAEQVREFSFDIADELKPAAKYAGAPVTSAVVDEDDDEMDLLDEVEEINDAEEEDEDIAVVEGADEFEEEEGSEFEVGDYVVTIVRGDEVEAQILEITEDGFKVKNVDENGEFLHKARTRSIVLTDIQGFSPTLERQDDAEPASGADESGSAFAELDAFDDEEEEGEIDLSLDDEEEEEVDVVEDDIDLSFVDEMTGEKVMSMIRDLCMQIYKGAGRAESDKVSGYFRENGIKKRSSAEELKTGVEYAVGVALANGITPDFLLEEA